MNLGYRWEIEGFDPSAYLATMASVTSREEWDLSLAWKVVPRIDLIGRYLHDQTNNRPLEQLAGLQWNDCCYGVQLVWREWIDDNDTARVGDDFNDRGLFLRFVFRGLVAWVKRPTATLSRRFLATVPRPYERPL